LWRRFNGAAEGGEANIWLSLEGCSLKKTMLGDGVSVENLDTSFYVTDGLVHFDMLTTGKSRCLVMRIYSEHIVVSIL
jgi:hypothetical protein